MFIHTKKTYRQFATAKWYGLFCKCQYCNAKCWDSWGSLSIGCVLSTSYKNISLPSDFSSQNSRGLLLNMMETLRPVGPNTLISPVIKAVGLFRYTIFSAQTFLPRNDDKYPHDVGTSDLLTARVYFEFWVELSFNCPRNVLLTSEWSVSIMINSVSEAQLLPRYVPCGSSATVIQV